MTVPDGLFSLAETMDAFIREAAPGWRAHRLSGGHRHGWSVSVSGNWRVTLVLIYVAKNCLFSISRFFARADSQSDF